MWTNRGAHPGYAVGIVESFYKTDLNVFFTLHNGNTTARKGDIVVWAYGQAMYPISHVAVVVADRGANVLTLSQNSSAARPDLPGYSPQASGPAILQLLPKAKCWYLRPKPSQWWTPGADANPNAGAVGTTPIVEEDPMPKVNGYRSKGGHRVTLRKGKWRTLSFKKGHVSFVTGAVEFNAVARIRVDGVPKGDDLKVRFVKVDYRNGKARHTRSYGTHDFVSTGGGDYLVHTNQGEMSKHERLRVQVLQSSVNKATVHHWDGRVQYWEK